MRILKENTSALIIDIQERLYPHIFEYEKIGKNTSKLIQGLKILDVPILVTQQYTKALGETVDIIKTALGSFKEIEKISFSCCDDQDFSGSLENLGKRNVIVAGIEAHVCVCQTIIDLAEKGYNPVVVADCISSRKESDKTLAIERMKQEGATITSYEAILFELTRKAGTDKFKLISKLVK
jgi:hypothetical protein